PMAAGKIARTVPRNDGRTGPRRSPPARRHGRGRATGQRVGPGPRAGRLWGPGPSTRLADTFRPCPGQVTATDPRPGVVRSGGVASPRGGRMPVPNPDEPRILILHATAGSGHKRAAQALERAFVTVAPQARVRAVDTLHF